MERSASETGLTGRNEHSVSSTQNQSSFGLCIGTNRSNIKILIFFAFLSLDRFKDEIECDRIVLRAFLSPHLVATFRASKPDYLHQLLHETGGAGGGEGPDGGGHGRKSFSSGAKAAAQVGIVFFWLVGWDGRMGNVI